MSPPRFLARAAALAAVISLGAAGAASASKADRHRDSASPRTLYATTDQNQLIRFNARNPELVRDVRSITGLPTGVNLRGIDFRPLTGDLYGVGSDSVLYRVNPRTGIAVSEGAPFTPALQGRFFGVDFNPTVDKVRVVSDAGQNLRLNVDEGTVLSNDRALNPGTPRVVGAGYLNSSFSATKPLATTLLVVDSASDMLFTQAPPNDGTLTMGKRLGIDVSDDAGFDIAGAENTGYLATKVRRPRARTKLYTVDPTSGATRSLGRIGGGRLVITGLAAWQD